MLRDVRAGSLHALFAAFSAVGDDGNENISVDLHTLAN